MIVLGIILAVIVIFAIVLLVVVDSQKDESWKPLVRGRLKETTSHVRRHDATSMKAALFDLDSLLDHALKGKHLKGDTMGSRLMSAKPLFTRATYNDIWEAHKYRNKVIHQPEYTPRLAELQHHVRSLTSALNAILQK